MLKIDVHTHILPPPSDWPDLSDRYGYAGWIALEEIRRAGAGGCGCARMLRIEQGPDGRAGRNADGTPKRTFFREIQDNCWDPAVRIREMDQRMGEGEGVQALSTVPVMFGYWARPEHTNDLSRFLNDHIAGVVRAHPDRYIGLGTVPMNDPVLAVRELERCVRDLGFAGVQIGSNINGIDLGDARFHEFFAAAQQLDACIFVHPWDMLAPPAPAGPFPVPPPIPERFRKYWHAWLVGMPAETGLAVCSILFSGLLDRCPRLRIGFAHGGGSFPGTIGRIEHGFVARPDLCQTDTQRSPRSYLRTQQPTGPAGGSNSSPARFYVDSLTHDADTLRTLLRLFGPERIFLGSDYPFPLGEDNPGEMIESMRDLAAATRARLLNGTAIEFLGTAAQRFVRR